MFYRKKSHTLKPSGVTGGVLTCPVLAAESRRSSCFLCVWPPAAPDCRVASAVWSAWNKRHHSTLDNKQIAKMQGNALLWMIESFGV